MRTLRRFIAHKNLNVKIEHEVRVQIEKQLEDTIFNENSGLF